MKNPKTFFVLLFCFSILGNLILGIALAGRIADRRACCDVDLLFERLQLRTTAVQGSLLYPMSVEANIVSIEKAHAGLMVVIEVVNTTQYSVFLYYGSRGSITPIKVDIYREGYWGRIESIYPVPARPMTRAYVLERGESRVFRHTVLRGYADYPCGLYRLVKFVYVGVDEDVHWSEIWAEPSYNTSGYIVAQFIVTCATPTGERQIFWN